MQNSRFIHACPPRLTAILRQGVLLALLFTLLLIGGCAGIAKSPAQKSAMKTDQAAHDRQGYQHAETAYLAGDYPQALRILKPLAEQGDAEAQYILGYMYYYGQGVESDPRVARDWINKSAVQGHDKARIALSRFDARRTEQEAEEQELAAPEEAALQNQMSPQAPAASNISTTFIEQQMVEPEIAEQEMAEPQSSQKSTLTMNPAQLKSEAKPTMDEAKPTPQPGNYEWILAQSPEHVTIQLLATHDRPAAQTFIRRNGISAEAVVFQFLRNGKTWFSVIYGAFPGSDEAKAAIETMPSALRRQPSWIRSFGGIHNIIVPPSQ